MVCISIDHINWLYCRFINTLAGSGSLITLPVLIFLGLPVTMANGTNRVSILLESLTGTSSFHRREVLDLKGVIILGAPAVIGSIVGAQIAVNLNEQLMRQVIGIVMVIMLFIILIQPESWLIGKTTRVDGLPSIKQVLIFFSIGVYGGFIQAGVGIFLLASLVLSAGYDLVRANAVKVGIVLFYTIFAMAVFIKNGQINWGIGLMLGVGSMLGAWTAAHVAVIRGTKWVRRVLIIIVLFSAIQLLGLFDLLKSV